MRLRVTARARANDSASHCNNVDLPAPGTPSTTIFCATCNAVSTSIFSASLCLSVIARSVLRDEAISKSRVGDCFAA